MYIMDIDEELAIINGTIAPATEKTTEPQLNYRDMVIKALTVLQEKGGSSRLKILRYIVSQFNVADETRANVHLKLALKNAVNDGTLVQSNGTGAAGSFRLSDATLSAQSKGKKPTKANGGSIAANSQSSKKGPGKPKAGAVKQKAPVGKKRVVKKASTSSQTGGVTNKGKANAKRNGVTEVDKPADTNKKLTGKKGAIGSAKPKSVKAATPKATSAKTKPKKSVPTQQTPDKNSKNASAKKVTKAKQNMNVKSTTTVKRITRNSMKKKS